MTVRRTRKVPTSPEQVAAAVNPAALAVFPPVDYRSFFRALTEEVEDLTGQYDHGLTMRVAEALGVSPSDWFRVKLTAWNG